MTARVVLVESIPAAPGLLGASAWRVLQDAEVVLLRDPGAHPSAPHLAMAGVEVGRIPDGTFDVRDRRDLLATPGDVPDRKLATGLCDAAHEQGEQVVLLGPGDEGLGRAVGLEAARRDVEVEWVFLAELPPGGEVLRLVGVQRRLLDPEDGCPWDLEQDHASLARFLVEETYETLDAIAGGDDRELVEELGDVLMQVVFHAQLGSDRRAFTIDDVARGIADKLVRRHPHVFGDATAEDADAVVANWAELKAEEKPERDGPFDGVAASQPAVPLATKVRSRMQRHHLPVPSADELVATLVDGAADVAALPAGPQRDAAVGELLHAAVALAAEGGSDPELALRAAVDRSRAVGLGVLELARGRDVDLATADAEQRRALLDEARERFGD